MSERLQTAVVGTVLVMWVTLTALSFALPDHDVPTTVDSIMGIVAGGAVASEVVRRAMRVRTPAGLAPSEPTAIVQPEDSPKGGKA